MVERVAEELRSLVGQRPEIVDDPRLARALLGDVCPTSPREVSLLVAAVEENVAATLARPGDLPVSHQSARLSKQLADARGLSDEAASWAVAAWAYAVGAGPVPGPDRPRPGAASASLAGRPVDVPESATAYGQFARSPVETNEDEKTAATGRRPAWLLPALMAVAVVAVIGLILALVIPRGLSAGPPPVGSPPATDEPPSPPSPGDPPSAGPSDGPTGAGSPGPLTVVAHAGGGEKYAEETLPALLHGAKLGAAVEMDMRWTADDVAILLHGRVTPTVEHASVRDAIVCDDGPLVVAETTWAVLKDQCSSVAWASDDGKRYPIATFDEAMKELAAVPGVRVLTELKDNHQTKEQDDEFLATIAKYGMVDRTVVTSYRQETLDRIDQAASNEGLFLRRMLNLSPTEGARLPDPAVLAREGLWAVALRSDRVTESYFTAARSAGLVAIAQDVAPPRGGRQARELTTIWKAMRAAGATTVSTDEPKAYQRFAG